MPEFSFAVPLVKGKTEVWRKAVAEINGPRNAAYKESRGKLGIRREHVSLQSTPMGDLVVVHIDAPDQGVLGAMMRSESDFDTWFRNTILIDAHGFDPNASPSPVEVVLDYKG